jgi:hypothetical protein
MSILLVTKNRYDRLLSVHRTEKASREAERATREDRLAVLQARIDGMVAKLSEADAVIAARTNDVGILTRLINDDGVRRRGVEIANSEIIIWKVDANGDNEPPMVRNTIAGLYDRYVGLRPKDLTDLLPGMVGISILPRTNEATSDALSTVTDAAADTIHDHD